MGFGVDEVFDKFILSAGIQLAAGMDFDTTKEKVRFILLCTSLRYLNTKMYD